MPRTALRTGLCILAGLYGMARGDLPTGTWGPPPGMATGTAAETLSGAGDPEDAPGSGAGWEISPSLGLMGGSVLLGLKASMAYRPVTLEAAVDQVMGRTATLFPFTVNAVLDMSAPARVVPFAIVGGGLFLTVPTNSVGNETISTMGLNFGGGLRFYLNRKLGFRFETKQLFTRVENSLETVKREELLIFQSSSLGVIFAFD
jgi:hypothetical protein